MSEVVDLAAVRREREAVRCDCGWLVPTVRVDHDVTRFWMLCPNCGQEFVYDESEGDTPA